MSVITELHDKIQEGADAVKGWVGEIEGHLPALVEAAAKYEQSPIVQALEGAILPPNVEQQIAKLISEASAAFAQHGSATVNGTAGPAEPTTEQPTPDPVESDAAPAATDAPPAA